MSQKQLKDKYEKVEIKDFIWVNYSSIQEKVKEVKDKYEKVMVYYFF